MLIESHSSHCGCKSLKGGEKRVNTSIWKLRLLKYGLPLISLTLLALSLAGVVAAERYKPNHEVRHL